MVACRRPDIGAPSAARLADEQALKVKQPNVSGHRSPLILTACAHL